MSLTYSSRAFVLAGEGVGQSAFPRLCRECGCLRGYGAAETPQRSKQRVRGRADALLLEDPLNRGPTVELNFVEVPCWWVEADLRSCVRERKSFSDCAVLLVDVCNADSFDAARLRGQWAMAAGLRCVTVLSFSGPCQGKAFPSPLRSRLVQQERLDWLSDEMSLVKPSHFDCTLEAIGSGSPQFQLELFLKVLTLRLLWLNLAPIETSGSQAKAPASLSTPSSRRWTGPALSSRSDSVPGRRQPRQGASPGPPRCAHILPARYMPGIRTAPDGPPRGRTWWGSEPRSVSPRRPSPPVQWSSRQAGRNRSPLHIRRRSESAGRSEPQEAMASEGEDVRSSDGNPASLAAAEAKRLVAAGPQGPLRRPQQEQERRKSVELSGTTNNGAHPEEDAPLETVINLSTLAERSREGAEESRAERLPQAGPSRSQESPPRSKRSCIFKVDMDVGGGVTVPFTVAEDTDLEAVTAEVVRLHGLSGIEHRRIVRYLQQVRAHVVAGAKAETIVDLWIEEVIRGDLGLEAKAAPRMRPRRVLSIASLAALLGAFLAGSLLASAGDAFASTINQKYTATGKYIPKKYRRWKPTVVLLQDHPKLGKKGDVVTVKKGYYRNILYPEGVAKRQDASIMKQLDQEARLKSKEAATQLAEALKKKDAIEKHGPFIFEKKVREDKENIYGSLSQINVAEEIVKATAVPVRQVSVQIPKITKVGTYRGTIEFLPEVIAVIEIKVVPEGYEEVPDALVAELARWRREVCGSCGAKAMFYCPFCCTPLGVPDGVTVPRARLPFARCDIIFDDAPKKATSIHAKVLAPEQVRLIDLFTTEANTNRTLSRPGGGTATKADFEDSRGVPSNAVIREIPEYDPHITLVLFPDDSSATFEEVATEPDFGSPDRLTLVVIDSPWKRAQVLRKHPRLAKLRSIRLGHPPPSRFWRYHSEGTGCVSTVEALAALAKEVLPRTGGAAEGSEPLGFDSFMDDPFLFFFVRQFAYISENKRTAGAGERPMDPAAKQRRMEQVRQKEAKRLKLRPFGRGSPVHEDVGDAASGELSENRAGKCVPALDCSMGSDQ
ncbi:rplI [Symbiodinium sp. KB8]|nr:rplI [Symbiodinium sp. KB8]